MKTHGMAGTNIYYIWTQMKQRCSNPNHPKYEDYGGRDIKVCERWLKFENFYEDMGDPPEGKWLERENNNKGYSKDNCLWETIEKQQNNKRNNRKISFKGEVLGINQWSKRIGISHATLIHRLTKYPIDVALTADKTPGKKLL